MALYDGLEKCETMCKMWEDKRMICPVCRGTMRWNNEIFVCPVCGYDDTPNPKPQTNYDRLISKTPEELAEWMATKTSCMRCPVDLDACHKFEFSGEMSCEEILLSWLKSPAKDVDNGT
jgi:predicted amidophosphoribosyltransferase